MAILVGTSGFDYKDWRGPFYPRFIKGGDRLAYFAQQFDTVELNVTFYRMPAATAFRGWRDAVPDGFVFAVKASRYLTHIKRLQDPQGSRSDETGGQRDGKGLGGQHGGARRLRCGPAGDP